MTIASGISKLLTFKKQGSGLGTAAGTGSAQNMRRVKSTIDLTKATYTSNEINPAQQVSDFRHGLRSVAGTISSELSVGTFQSFFESICRQAASTAITTGAITTVTAASTSGAAGTFTRSGGSYFTDGFKLGMVMRWSGFTSTGATNNATNMLITALTATVMTVLRLDGVAVGGMASGDTVTGLEVGKHVYIPTSGHTRDYYTFEHDFADIVQAEQFVDCVLDKCDVKLPPTGLATIDWAVKGLNMTTSTSPYFVSPTAVSTGSALAAANGALYVNGSPVALITGLDFTINGNYTTPGGVVGSNIDPDIFPGRVMVTGQATVLFQDATMRDMFLNETEVSIISVFTSDHTATSGFTGFTFPRVKIGGAAKDDGEKGLVMTMPFTALENINGGTGTNSLVTTIMIQDSSFS